MTLYLCCGDVHGEFDDLNCVINQAIKKYNIDAVIQVGDFGFYPLVFDKYKNLKFNVPVYAIDGNHEHTIWLRKELKKGMAPIWKQNHNIEYIPRGTVWEKDGCSIGFLGGAMSVDRAQHGSTKKRDTNYILNVEVKEALKTFNDFGKLDFLITHSCPHSIGVGMQGKMCFVESVQKYIEIPFNISTGPLNDCGEQALTNLWNGLKDKPLNVIYGHFHSHRQAKVGTTMFTCIGCVDCLGGHDFTYPYIIDTEKKTFEAFPSDKLFNTQHFKKHEHLEKNDYPI